MKEQLVLAYSGGLDTTVIIPWLKENYDYDIIAACIDVGQGDETDGLKEKAIRTGASKFYLVNCEDEFVRDYIYPILKANAIYEGKYLLGTSVARPLIAKKLVEIALKEKAVAIAHGATGKGNDQVRFELTIKALAPNSPWREWDLYSREDEIKYLEDRNIPIPMKKDDSYSRDKNLWHLSHEGLELEDTSNMPDYERLLKLSNTIEKAPDEAQYVEIEFEQGIPIKVDGNKLSPSDLVKYLNKIGGNHAIGIVDMVENRVVGIKSRGVYETPGGSILYAAHRELEYLCLDKDTLAFKEIAANKLTDLVYSGKWFTTLRESLSAFIDETQKTVSGKVKLKLYKGNIIPAGTYSPYSLYNESLASFTTGELYNHKDAEGFITLFGLPLKVNALMKEHIKKEKVKKVEEKN